MADHHYNLFYCCGSSVSNSLPFCMRCYQLNPYYIPIPTTVGPGRYEHRLQSPPSYQDIHRDSSQYENQGGYGIPTMSQGTYNRPLLPLYSLNPLQHGYPPVAFSQQQQYRLNPQQVQSQHLPVTSGAYAIQRSMQNPNHGQVQQQYQQNPQQQHEYKSQPVTSGACAIQPSMQHFSQDQVQLYNMTDYPDRSCSTSSAIGGLGTPQSGRGRGLYYPPGHSEVTQPSNRRNSFSSNDRSNFSECNLDAISMQSKSGQDLLHAESNNNNSIDKDSKQNKDLKNAGKRPTDVEHTFDASMPSTIDKDCNNKEKMTRCSEPELDASKPQTKDKDLKNEDKRTNGSVPTTDSSGLQTDTVELKTKRGDTMDIKPEADTSKVENENQSENAESVGKNGISNNENIEERKGAHSDKEHYSIQESTSSKSNKSDKIDDKHIFSKNVQEARSSEDAVFGECKRSSTDAEAPASHQHRQEQKNRNEKTIRVQFKVYVSPQFELKNESKVFIKFGDDSLGGWSDSSNVQHQMKKIEKRAENYWLMEYTVDIPHVLVRKNLQYKYMIKYEKHHWEYLVSSSHEKHRNRELRIPKERLPDDGKWIQYDGIIIKTPSKGFLQKLGLRSDSVPDHLMEDIKFAVHAMFPKWIGFQNNAGNEDLIGEDVLKQVDHICFCLSQFTNYYSRNPSNAFSQILKGYFQAKMEYFKTISNELKETDEDACLRLTSALAILHIGMMYDGILDKDDCKALCFALCLRPGKTNNLPDYASLDIHYPGMRKLLKVDLKKFIKQICEKEPMWVLTIPLLHFMGDYVSLERSLKISKKLDSQEWWGTASIAEHVEKSAETITGSDIVAYQKHLMPLLPFDPLLPRTLAALVTYKRIDDTNKDMFSAEAILGNLKYHYFKWQYNDENSVVPVMKYVREKIQAKHDFISNTTDDKELQKEIEVADMQADIALNLLNTMSSLRKYKLFDQIVNLVAEIINNGVLAFDKLPNTIRDDIETRVKKALAELSEQMWEKTRNWLCRALDYSLYKIPQFEINLFDQLFKVHFTEAAAGENWILHLSDFLKQRYARMEPMAKIDVYCDTDFKNLDNHMEKLLTDLAFQSVDELCLKFNGKMDWLFCSDRSDINKVGRVLSEVFLRMWRENELETTELLSWQGFPRYVSTLNKYEAVLSEECRQGIGIALQQFEIMKLNLFSGDITIGELEKSKNNNLMQIEQALHSDKGQCDMINTVLGWRKLELECFDETRDHVHHFYQFCQNLEPADSRALRQKFDTDRANLKIAEVCAARKFIEDEIVQDKYQPQISYFGFNDEVLKCSVQSKKLERSSSFLLLWKRQGYQIKRQYGENLTYDIIVRDVWKPCHHQMLEIARSLDDMSITFADIVEYFGTYKHKIDDVKTELRVIGDCADIQFRDWVEKRARKIEQYFQVDTYVKGARIMHNLKEKFRLQGDFRQLDILQSMAGKGDGLMADINDQLMSAGESLKGITKEQVDCLDEFKESSELVEWLKKSLDGPGQVKVLVDLAMITAHGQGDMEVKKVKCLHSATIGYAPLIYELSPDVDFDKFLGLCKSVWRSLESDPELPINLRETQRHLDWLKRVKESKGSMELNAFAQAELINNAGIYQIGCIRDKQPQIFEEALRLVIPQDAEKKIEKQEYTYQQLNDLQSRLMLVAGRAQEGKHHVDRFVEIFDGITRMATLYIKLCQAGSILFKNWKATFYCDPDRVVNVMIELGISDRHIIGENSHLYTVTEQIQEICGFLENSLMEWIEHIGVKRTEFPVLNHFTTGQLVILRRELAAVYSEKVINLCVYPMLHAVHEHCTEQILKDAADSALRELTEAQSAVEPGITTGMQEDENHEPDVDENETKQDFIQKIIDSGLSEELAQLAFVKYGADGFQEALLWCMEQDGDSTGSESDDSKQAIEEDITSDRVTFHQAPEITLDKLTSELMDSIGQNPGSVKNKLENLWTGYLSKVSTSISDYLSVEHLGQILMELEQPDKLDRPFPRYLHLGRPNLIISSQAEILRTILNLYMYEEGHEKPLPQSDEVLLCCAETTAEQVELLLRRAHFDESGKLYCLANIGQLTYDVAHKCEEYFGNNCHKEDLRLTVICSRETEDHSYIVTYLDQFRVQYQSQYTLTQIQAYVSKHYIVNDDWAAGSLDPESSAVRFIKSDRAGVGKSLRVRRLAENLQHRALENVRMRDRRPLRVTIPIQRQHVDMKVIMDRLENYLPNPDQHIPRIFHIDLAHEVLHGVDHLLFNLLVLGNIMDKDGRVWQRSLMDLYIVEAMPLMRRDIVRQGAGEVVTYAHHVLELLPSLVCWGPAECLLILGKENAEMMRRHPHWRPNDNDQLMDDAEWRSETFQRPYQYLKRYGAPGVTNLQGIHPNRAEDDQLACLRVLTSYCGLRDPSWAELYHFVQFLNIQLRDCEQSDFCCTPEVEQDLPGFRLFVLKFMINMSRDFATRSLNITEESPGMIEHPVDEDEDIDRFILKRRWETSPHPYVFFNADRHSMTFVGFKVNPNGDILEPTTGEILDHQVIPSPLQQALSRNRVQLNENFDNLPRDQKIERLCNVMGLDMPHDPDDTYELTTDNVKKILAIHMRFRCAIPVVVMGETGCGKTRLVKFMCDLQKPPGADVQNLILMKVHGGTTEEEIIRIVKRAAAKADENHKEFRDMDTVLFFDEANTTDSIGLIKEIMCDGRMRGEPLPATNRLKFVVACNPYRKHSDEVIKKLEQAGLGYHVNADETRDRLGRIPMRQLVYRVHALPQSMLPLVWDFGQLNVETEERYISQMVNRYVRNGKIPNIPGMVPVVSSILTASQHFMKEQKDECSFVSLRDVDRVLRVMAWFNQHSDHIFPDLIDMKEDSEHVSEDENDENPQMNGVTKMLVLALGVCYHASLQKREEYRTAISVKFEYPLTLPRGAQDIDNTINRCQDLFLDNIDIGPNIAKNQALKENLFMMIICIELRIPLFLVGKPGSSKSLAKTIVDDAMQGEASRHDLFRRLKQVHMISFQCSPLSTPDGIVSTFRQCAQLQDKQNLDNYVAVVVLDEVGLAEDSPLMPLKTLHPLLEDGCQGDEEPAPHKKVACVAISNWALDPAKMNRGIHVQRCAPLMEELVNSAKGICAEGDERVKQRFQGLVRPLAEGYLRLYELAIDEKREFFGLRDFYSLVKMVHMYVKTSSRKEIKRDQMKQAILRNFGGLDGINPLESFQDALAMDTNAQGIAACSPAQMIRVSLCNDSQESESRYLLILTENYAALGLMQQQLLLDHTKTTVIFGSSFPKDQEYTQVCRNINKIKICMEAGRVVVLLNLENLYESLYDALNQYYVKLGNSRFVDLGLGNQRVKCEVHKDFKLVVVAEKKVVYEKFPIPLINRLEKHFLAMSTMLSKEQIEVVDKLSLWIEQFANIMRGSPQQVHDVFIGYHVDTPATLVMFVCNVIRCNAGDDMWAHEVLERSQDLLLQCATPDAVVRLKETTLPQELTDQYAHRYHVDQKHDSLLELLEQQILNKQHDSGLFLQITTHSKLLSLAETNYIGQLLSFKAENIKLTSLQAFETEHQFSKMLRGYFSKGDSERILVLQCDGGHHCGDLIACARYIIQDEYSQNINNSAIIHIILIIQLPRVSRTHFVGFQGGQWVCYHIDDLHPEVKKELPPLVELENSSLASLYREALMNHRQIPQSAVEPMDTECTDSWEEYRDETCDSSDTEQSFQKIGSYGDADLRDISMEFVPSHIPDNIVREVLCRREADAQMSIENREVEIPIMSAAGDASKSSRYLFDIDSLLRRCIHGAAALLVDHEADRDRKTKRVQLLLDIINQSSGEESSVLDVVHQRIQLLLEDKEQNYSTLDRSKKWLCIEAASHKSVNKAGTFRQATKQCIEAKVTPLLAGLIAHIDRNHNMDIILNQSNPWLRRIWLQMLLDANISPLKYQDLQAVSVTTNRDGEELREYRVVSSGHNNTVFSAALPFSWIFYNQISLLQLQTKDEQKIEELLRKCAVGRIVKLVEETHHLSDLITLYLHDFTHMVYCARSQNKEQEYELVARSIQVANVERHVKDGIFQEDTLTLAGIHLTYDHIQRRINVCSRAFELWPECVQILHDKTTVEHPTLFGTDDELTLDVQILYLILNDLALEKDFDKCPLKSRSAWTAKLEKFRPIIEGILTCVNGEYVREYGEISREYSRLCMYMWTRIMAIYLFVIHVCPPNITTNAPKQYNCLMFWNLLGDKANFHTIQSVESVEKFLKTCNVVASQIYYKKQKCKNCKKELDDPVELPCSDRVCGKCFNEMKALGTMVCPDHPTINIAEDFVARPPSTMKKQVAEHNNYKRRCNLFFMELVSQLCFHGSSTPDRDVVNKLMSYVTCQNKLDAQMQTRQMTVLGDSIDPTPVVRSFLLQLLLRSSLEAVREHITGFIEKFRLILQNSEQMVEFSMLCIHCLEDHYSRQGYKFGTIKDRVGFIHRLLSANKNYLNSPNLDMHKLESIATVRYVLTEVAKMIHDAFVMNKYAVHVLKRLLDEVKPLCMEHIGDNTCHQFLMTLIFKQYGYDVLQRMGRMQQIEWVLPPQARNATENTRADKLVSLGNEYIEMRECLTRVMLGEDVQQIAEIQNAQLCDDITKQRNLVLAVYSTITCSMVQHGAQRPDPQKLDEISVLVNGELSEVLVGRLVNNTLSIQCNQLTVTANQPPAHQDLLELLIHFWFTVTSVEENSLPGPLCLIVQQPGEMNQSYLPTMPSDNLEEVRAALQDARSTNIRGSDPNATMWQCSNGHIYIIGDCGRPYYESRCNTCGEIIGGQGHHPATGNTQIGQIGSRTSPGHILGRAAQRSSEPAPERLNAVQTSILRMLLHMSMFLGANRNSANLSGLIRQPNNVADVGHFLWEHLNHDLRVIGRALHKNTEDVIIFMHLLIHRIVTLNAQGLGHLDQFLRTKEARIEWEIRFAQHYIAPILQEFEHELQVVNQRIASDNRLGNNPIMCTLYRTDIGTQGEIRTEHLEREPSVWKIQERITLEKLRQNFQKLAGDQQTTIRDYKLLQLFLQQEHRLRVVRCLPGIIRLQQMLSQKLYRNIDSADALKLSINDFMRNHIEEHLKEEFKTYLDGFSEAWECLRGEIGTFAVGGSTVPSEYCEHPVTAESSLATILPTLRGPGLCSTVLVHVLLGIHNEFMEKYSAISKQSLSVSMSCQDISKAHLVAYHPEQDLRPIILANCNYELKVGQQTTINFDFAGLQRQLEERFIRGRPRVVPNVPLIVFREEFTDAAVFDQLRNKIPQEPLPGSISQRISRELRHLTQLNNCLATLEKTIGFLTSVGGDPESSLVEFITDTLKMEDIALCRIIQDCGLKHTKSIWLVLSHERAKLLAAGEQDVFDHLAPGYEEDVPAEHADALERYFRNLHQLDQFLIQLYECILLHIGRRSQNQDENTDNREQPLGYVLDVYLDDNKYTEIPGLTDGRFPDEVCVKHCVATWKTASLRRQTMR